jgi:hypothetical protein
LRRARDFSTKRRASRKGLALTLASALAFAIAAQQTLASRAQLHEAEARAAEARRDLTALRDRLKRADGRSGADQAAMARAVGATQSPPSRVLRDMIGLMPSGVRFDHLELIYGREVEVEVEVVARRVADYDEFMERLAASSRFASVAPGPEVREAEMRASVHAVYRAGASR